MARRRYRRDDNIVGKTCISMILIVFVAVMSIQIVRIYQKNQTYAAKQSELEAQYEEELSRQEELKEYEAYTKTKEYTEQQANKQGLVYDNQIIFKETDN